MNMNLGIETQTKRSWVWFRFSGQYGVNLGLSEILVITHTYISPYKGSLFLRDPYPRIVGRYCKYRRKRAKQVWVKSHLSLPLQDSRHRRKTN